MKDGFGNDCANAVFLDLPEPWLAIENAKKALFKNCQTKICCFSPCIEQVQKTCQALRANGFVELCMYECLSKNHEIESKTIKCLSNSNDAAENSKALPCSDIISSSALDNTEKNESVSIDDDENCNPRKKFKEHHSKFIKKIIDVTYVSNEIKGHTSFLTFATLLKSSQ